MNYEKFNKIGKKVGLIKNGAVDETRTRNA